MTNLSDPVSATQTEAEDVVSPESDAAQSASQDTSTEQTTTEESTPRKRTRLHQHKHFWAGLAIVCALSLYAITNLPQVAGFFKSVGNILSPLVIGGVIAYLCNPFLKFYEFVLFRRMKNSGMRRGLSLTMTIFTAIAIVTAIVVMMIPQLVASIKDLLDNFDTYLDGLVNFLNSTIHSIMSGVSENAQENATYITREQIEAAVGNFSSAGDIGSKLFDFINQQKGLLAAGFMGAVNVLKNMLLGIFIAIYLLASKEKRIAQIRKFRAAMFTDKQNRRIDEYTKLTDHCFGGFIYGKIMDSLVIGCLTFVLLSIFSVSPYNLLIATFIGLTNIIPVFGPFIGAIPSFFIVLISNPGKAIFFLLLILLIQQLDGNIIGPKILGDNTGVSSLSVIIAITIAGSLWGIWGMLIGVPIFAVFIEVIRRILEHRLEAQGRPTDTTAYYPSDALGNAEKDVHYEHAGLRYRYEHSKLKPRVDRILAKFYRRPYVPDGEQAEPPSASVENTEASEQPKDESSDT